MMRKRVEYDPWSDLMNVDLNSDLAALAQRDTDVNAFSQLGRGDLRDTGGLVDGG